MADEWMSALMLFSDQVENGLSRLLKKSTVTVWRYAAWRIQPT